MYCVIQEIETKKPNKHGYSKELISEYYTMSLNGYDISHYSHRYSYEKFERPIQKAYKISIHESYRENGRVKKKQYVICTARYYDIAERWFSVYEDCSNKISKIAQELNIDESILYELVDSKVTPFCDNIINEYEQTDEFITHEEHQRIIKLYNENMDKFISEYECDKTTYQQIYDVYGNLMNEDKLKKVQEDFKARKEYEEKSRSYQEQNYSNYYDSFFNRSNKGSSSYSNNSHSNHNEEDKDTLKQFYRVLSKKFHPDANPDKDTSNEMKLLNQLKKEWGL